MLFEYRPLSSVLLAVDEAVGPIWREVGAVEKVAVQAKGPEGGQGVGEHVSHVPTLDGCGVTKCYFAAEGYEGDVGSSAFAAVRVRVRVAGAEASIGNAAMLRWARGIVSEAGNDVGLCFELGGAEVCPLGSRAECSAEEAADGRGVAIHVKRKRVETDASARVGRRFRALGFRDPQTGEATAISLAGGPATVLHPAAFGGVLGRALVMDAALEVCDREGERGEVRAFHEQLRIHHGLDPTALEEGQVLAGAVLTLHSREVKSCGGGLWLGEPDRDVIKAMASEVLAAVQTSTAPPRVEVLQSPKEALVAGCAAVMVSNIRSVAEAAGSVELLGMLSRVDRPSAVAPTPPS